MDKPQRKRQMVSSFPQIAIIEKMPASICFGICIAEQMAGEILHATAYIASPCSLYSLLSMALCMHIISGLSNFRFSLSTHNLCAGLDYDPFYAGTPLVPGSWVVYHHVDLTTPA